MVVNPVDIDGQMVRNDDFFKKAPEHEPEAVGRFFVVEGAPAPELRHQEMGAVDGSCQELGPERREEGEYPQVALRLRFAVVDIRDVAEGLEGVKGYPHRQKHVKERQVVKDIEGLQRFRGGPAEKIEILEQKQEADIEKNADPQIFLPSRFVRENGHPHSQEIIDQGRSHEEENVFELPAGIKIITRRKEQHPAEPVGNGIVDPRDDQEKNRELEGTEQHVRRFSPCSYSCS